MTEGKFCKRKRRYMSAGISTAVVCTGKERLIRHDAACRSILLEEVLTAAAIGRLKHNKSPGPDGICVDAIQAGG